MATVGEKRGEVSHLTYESTKLSAERQEEKCNLSSNEQQNNYVETECESGEGERPWGKRRRAAVFPTPSPPLPYNKNTSML